MLFILGIVGIKICGEVLERCDKFQNWELLLLIIKSDMIVWKSKEFCSHSHLAHHGCENSCLKAWLWVRIKLVVVLTSTHTVVSLTLNTVSHIQFRIYYSVIPTILTLISLLQCRAIAQYCSTLKTRILTLILSRCRLVSGVFCCQDTVALAHSLDSLLSQPYWDSLVWNN